MFGSCQKAFFRISTFNLVIIINFRIKMFKEEVYKNIVVDVE